MNKSNCMSYVPAKAGVDGFDKFYITTDGDKNR
jgi:hypothetical protein